MNKGQMSLEYIVKIMILLVVVAVVIGLTIKFKNDIQLLIKNIFGRDEAKHNFPEIKGKNSFSPGEISVYIESCYSTMASLPEDEQSDIVCYLLDSLDSKTGFSLTRQEIMNSVSSDLKDKVEITASFGRDIIKVEYQDIGNKILVSD